MSSSYVLLIHLSPTLATLHFPLKTKVSNCLVETWGRLEWNRTKKFPVFCLTKCGNIIRRDTTSATWQDQCLVACHSHGVSRASKIKPTSTRRRAKMALVFEEVFIIDLTTSQKIPAKGRALGGLKFPRVCITHLDWLFPAQTNSAGGPSCFIQKNHAHMASRCACTCLCIHT